MRNPIIDGKLQHLRINHDQFDIGRRGMKQQATEGAIQSHTFARSSRTRHEQMGNKRQVNNDSFSEYLCPKSILNLEGAVRNSSAIE